METYFHFQEPAPGIILDCRRGKTKNFFTTWSSPTIWKRTFFRLEKTIAKPHYLPTGQSIAFIVQKPKIREIFAADFRDRVSTTCSITISRHISRGLFNLWTPGLAGKARVRTVQMLRLQKFEAQLSKEYRQDNNNMYHTGLDKQTDQSTLSAVGQGDRCATKTNVHPGYYLKMDIKELL